MQATAAFLVGKRQIELRQTDLAPKENEVLIRVDACGICRGDVELFEREHERPRRLGHEPLGQIVAVGPWARDRSEGDWVVGCLDGGFATHTVARETDVYSVPAELGVLGSLAEALKCVTTVSRAAAPDFEDAVVVVGCGFMGLAAICTLSQSWQSRLVAVDPVAARRDAALECGATHALDPTACDVREAIFALTDGTGADVAVEFAGRPQAVTLAARTLRRRGRLVLGGGHTVGDAESTPIYMSAISVHHAPPAFSPDQADDWRRTIRAMADGRYPLERLVSHRFTLDGIQAAFETATSGPDVGYRKGIVLTT
jgi:threonine dehydrogenase-like Zn-dependent dehydrogenase